ncbi:hypothetical protein JW960_23255 [candidate division KSB1 bacterium]|nr:hypothetical protein [candidate division KSB1 bacterium]
MLKINWPFIKALIQNQYTSTMNREMIGFSLEEKLPAITDDDIQKFVRATNDANPVYQQATPLALPMFLSKLIFPLIRQL